MSGAVDRVTGVTKLRFTEKMKGFVTFGETDYHQGFREGRRAQTELMVHLRITINAIVQFVADSKHEAQVDGYVQCDALGGKLTVSAGTFNLFVDKDGPKYKEMLYRLYFCDSARHPLTLSGFKSIKDDPGFDLWKDTTTLFTRVLQGYVTPEREASANIVASGIITVHPLDFLKQLTTFRTEAATVFKSVSTLWQFLWLWLRSLWAVYKS
jgi:hypothetical protein